MNSFIKIQSHSNPKILPYYLPQFQKQQILKKIKIKIICRQYIKKLKKRAYKSKQRKFVLNQLRQTQQLYIKDCRFIQSKIAKPLLDADLITQQEKTFLFPELQQIITLAEWMYKEIDKHYKNFDRHNTIIAPSVNELSNYYLIYKQYMINYHKRFKIVERICKHQVYKEINKSLQPGDIQALWIKPIQRAQRYRLLLQRYLKYLPQGHKDQKQLIKSIENFHKVMSKNDEARAIQQKRQKIIRIQHMFGNILDSPSRRLLSQEWAMCINTPCKLYIFNDLILAAKVVTQYQQILQSKLYLNHQSKVKKLFDGSYLKNRILIFGVNQSLHLTFQSKDYRNKVLNAFQTIIDNLKHDRNSRKNMIEQINRQTLMAQYQNFGDYNKNILISPPSCLYPYINQAPPKVKLKITVDYSVQRPHYSIFHKKYIYAVKVQLEDKNIYQYLFLDMQEIQEIQYNLKILYKTFQNWSFHQRQLYVGQQQKLQKFQIPTIDLRSRIYQEIKSDKSKVVQYNSVNICHFLNFLFRNQKMRRNTQRSAYFLNIYDFIWQYCTQQQDKCPCRLCLHGSEVNSMVSYDKQVCQNDYTYTPENSNKMKNMMDQESGTSKASPRLNQKKYCPFRTFQVQQSISQNDYNGQDYQEMNIRQRLLYIHCKKGRVNSLMFNKIYRGEPKQLKVYFETIIKEPEYAVIKVYKDTTVRDALQQICASMKLPTPLEFALYIYIQQDTNIQRFFLDGDQFLWKICGSYGLYQQVHQTNFFQNFFKSSPKKKLMIKKLIKFDLNIQKRSLYVRRNQRMRILVNQVFWKLKNNFLHLQSNELIIICSIFYSLNRFQKQGIPKAKQLIKGIERKHIKKDILQRIVPQRLEYIFTDQFLDKIETKIKQFFPNSSANPDELLLSEKTIAKGIFQLSFEKHLQNQPKNEPLPGRMIKSDQRWKKKYKNMPNNNQNRFQTNNFSQNKNDNLQNQQKKKISLVSKENPTTDPQGIYFLLHKILLETAFNNKSYMTEYFQSYTNQNEILQSLRENNYIEQNTSIISNCFTAQSNNNVDKKSRKYSDNSCRFRISKSPSNTVNILKKLSSSNELITARKVYLGINFNSLTIVDNLINFKVLAEIPLNKLKYKAVGIAFFIQKSVLKQSLISQQKLPNKIMNQALSNKIKNSKDPIESKNLQRKNSNALFEQALDIAMYMEDEEEQHPLLKKQKSPDKKQNLKPIEKYFQFILKDVFTLTDLIETYKTYLQHFLQ